MISRTPSSSFLLITLMFIAILAFWMDYKTKTVETAVDDEMQQVEYIAEGVSGVQQEYDNSSHSIFFAKKMVQFGEVTNLEQPYFVYTEPDKPVIRLRANKAELIRKGEHIHLIGNVTVVRGDDDDETTLQTSFLHLIPDESILKTDKQVTIKSKQATINAVGMFLDNGVGIIQLLSQVRAVDH